MSSPTSHNLGGEWHTPQRARVRTLHDDAGLSFEAIEKQTGIPKSTAIKIAKASSSRRNVHDLEWEETRGRKGLISPEDIRKWERILEDNGIEGKKLGWAGLAYEAGLDVSEWTLKRAMGTMDYHMCVACKRGWASPAQQKKRVGWAELMLAKYPNPEDWHHIRWSDECHFGWGSEGKVWIIRKKGTRYCPGCIQNVQQKPEKEEKNQKRVHVWAAVVQNFKSDIIFYDVPGNTNGKMSLKVYRDDILEPVVKPWILQARKGLIAPFVLEEDGDSGHGTGKTNIVRTWKKDNGLESFFNCPSSPDLSPIELCWQAPKQYLRQIPHWDDTTTKELIVEGWDNLSMDRINELTGDMSKVMRDCIDAEGQMTGH